MTKYIHKPTGDTVDLEQWRWEAYFTDGSVLKQFDKLDEDNGEFHKFAEIDQGRVSHMRMVSDDPESYYTVLFNPALAAEGRMKLVHHYVNAGAATQRINEDMTITVDEPITSRAYVFGYDLDNKPHRLMITPSGEVILGDDMSRIALTIPMKEI